jgi:Zn-dependent protease with chaperone function
MTGIFQPIKEYIQIKLEQIKLKVIAQVSKLMSHVIVALLFAFLGLFILLFLSFALAAFLNTLFASPYLGFLLVGAFYFLLLLVVLVLAKNGKIRIWIENSIYESSQNLEEDE